MAAWSTANPPPKIKMRIFATVATTSSAPILLKFRYFTEHLDRAVGIDEFVEKLAVIVPSANGVSEQPIQPTGVFRFGLRHIANTGFEIFAISIHRADHDLVSKHEFDIDAICGHLDHVLTSRHAR